MFFYQIGVKSYRWIINRDNYNERCLRDRIFQYTQEWWFTLRLKFMTYQAFFRCETQAKAVSVTFSHWSSRLSEMGIVSQIFGVSVEVARSAPGHRLQPIGHLLLRIAQHFAQVRCVLVIFAALQKRDGKAAVTFAPRSTDSKNMF